MQAASAFAEQLGRHEAMTTAVPKVVLGSDGVMISVCRRTLRETIGLERDGCAEGQAQVTVAIDLTRGRGVLRFKVAGSEDESVQEAPALICAIVKSRGWLDGSSAARPPVSEILRLRKATTSGTSAGCCLWRSRRSRSPRLCSRESSRSTPRPTVCAYHSGRWVRSCVSLRFANVSFLRV